MFVLTVRTVSFCCVHYENEKKHSHIEKNDSNVYWGNKTLN